VTAPASKLHEIVTNANDLAPTTRERYLRDLNQWITFAGVEPAGWTRHQATAFYKSLLTRMRPQSANRLMASVAYASRWWAHFLGNPLLDFARVQTARAKDKKPQRALDEDAVRRLVAACDQSIAGVRDFALIVVGLETGMRRMSLTGMTIEDTLLDTAMLSLTPRWPYPATFVPLKGRDPAWVPLSDAAIMALGPWMRILATHDAIDGPLFRPLMWRVSRTTTRRLLPVAKPLSKSAIAKIFDDHAKKAGLGHVNPHLLRHTFVTERINQGLQPYDIAAITHHDITKALGALGGYMDVRAIGGRVRNATPPWLLELVRGRTNG
jgi:integrase